SLPRASGLRASTPPPTCSTVFRPLLLLLPLHTTLFSVPLLATTTFGSSGVRVTLPPPPPLLTSWRPARLVVCSSVTPLTTRGTDALTSPLAASLSPDTSSSTSRISPTPPPLHLLLTPSWSLCFRQTRWFSHRYLSVLFLQVFLARR